MTEEVKKEEPKKEEGKQPTETELWDKVQKDRAATTAADVGATEPAKDAGKDVGKDVAKADPADPYAGLPEPTRKLIEGLDTRLRETEVKFKSVNQKLATAHGTIGNLKQRLDASQVELQTFKPTVEAVAAEKAKAEKAAADAKLAKRKALRERLSDLPDVAELMDEVLPADAEPAVKVEPKAEPKKEEKAQPAKIQADERAQLIAERELSDLQPGWRAITASNEYKDFRAKLPADTRETNPSEDVAAAVADANALISAFKKQKEDAAKVAKVEAERQERLRRGEGPQGRGSSTGDVDTGPDALWNKVKRDREKARQAG